jgi:hypothetical protein
MMSFRAQGFSIRVSLHQYFILTKHPMMLPIAWVYWWPGSMVHLSNISFSLGDTINVILTVPSNTTTVATFTNLTTGKSVTQQVTNAAYPLCRANVQWMIGTESATLPNFGQCHSFLEAPEPL